MNLPAFLAAKRDGERHDDASLQAFVMGVASGDVPDYQAAAWLMAVMFRGLDDHETGVLTEAMADSGARLDLGDFQA
jgi:Thymidine phosphorylase